MSYQRNASTVFAVSMIGTLLAGIALTVQANDKVAPAPLALRKIMQEMERNMQVIINGIPNEDWALVAKMTPLIADHPQPPLGEKLRILGFIGTDAGKFKDLDKKSNLAALALQQAATRENGPGVVAAFTRLQDACNACHQGFRQSFTEHFYTQH